MTTTTTLTDGGTLAALHPISQTGPVLSVAIVDDGISTWLLTIAVQLTPGGPFAEIGSFVTIPGLVSVARSVAIVYWPGAGAWRITAQLVRGEAGSSIDVITATENEARAIAPGLTVQSDHAEQSPPEASMFVTFATVLMAGIGVDSTVRSVFMNQTRLDLSFKVKITSPLGITAGATDYIQVNIYRTTGGTRTLDKSWTSVLGLAANGQDSFDLNNTYGDSDIVSVEVVHAGAGKAYNLLLQFTTA
jgi:hypothetical protein